MQKNHVFFPAQRAHRIVADFEKKHLTLIDKKNIPKKNKFISGNKKTFFQLCFFYLFFSYASYLILFKIGLFFYFVALNNFSRNLSNVFFIWSPSLTFPKIGGMFFSFLNVFLPPSLIRFWIFSDLKQRNKNQWPYAGDIHEFDPIF